MQLHVDSQQNWVRTSTDQSFSGFWTRWCLDSPCWHTPVAACKTQCDDYSLHRESKMFHTNFMFELREKHYQSCHTDNNTAHSTVLSFWVLGLNLSALLKCPWMHHQGKFSKQSQLYYLNNISDSYRNIDDCDGLYFPCEFQETN